MTKKKEITIQLQKKVRETHTKKVVFLAWKGIFRWLKAHRTQFRCKNKNGSAEIACSSAFLRVCKCTIIDCIGPAIYVHDSWVFPLQQCTTPLSLRLEHHENSFQGSEKKKCNFRESLQQEGRNSKGVENKKSPTQAPSTATSHAISASRKILLICFVRGSRNALERNTEKLQHMTLVVRPKKQREKKIVHKESKKKFILWCLMYNFRQFLVRWCAGWLSSAARCASTAQTQPTDLIFISFIPVLVASILNSRKRIVYAII